MNGAVRRKATDESVTQKERNADASRLDRIRAKLAAETADGSADLTTPERPLHEYLAHVCEHSDVRAGVPLPPGAYARGEGANFAVFSRHSSRVRLELFDHPDDATSASVMELDSVHNRTGDMWHIWVAGIRPGQLYAYRVAGSYTNDSDCNIVSGSRQGLADERVATAFSPEWDQMEDWRCRGSVERNLTSWCSQEVLERTHP